MTASSLRKSLAVALACFISTLTLQAQQSRPNPDEKPRQVKEEPTTAYKEWYANAELILTESEKDTWKKLKSNEEREQFIKLVWELRDPDPDTEENEFKDEFYERLAYANEHFSSGKPGRMTDRGRIYIKFGKPDSIESHPMGGTYDRPSYEGGGSTSTYPFEKWFYRYLPNVASGVELEFVDPSGSGEYRLAKNPDEKDALIHVPGAGQTLAEQLGIEDRANRIAGLNGFGRVNYTRAQDSPFEVMNLLNTMESTQPAQRRMFGTTGTSTPITDDSTISFGVQTHYFRQTDNRVLAAMTIQVDNNDLKFSDSGGLRVARMNIFGRLTTLADRPAGRFEDSVTTSVTAEELIETRDRKSAYAKAFILEPGRYRLDVIVRDVETGSTGVRHVGLNVPTFSQDKLAASNIVLAAKLQDLSGQVGGGPFVIGTTKVIPNLTGEFKQGHPVGIYLQVYNAVIDQTLLRPAVDVEYVVLKDGKELSKQAEDWRTIDDAGQRLTLRRLIDSRNLSMGEYKIMVRIHDRVTNQTITPETTFSIIK